MSKRIIVVFSYVFRVPSLLQDHKAQADAEAAIGSSDSKEFIRIT